ncbi:MAG TPA: RNB domain-containing ribonuclease [Thermodesulfobacteriota bacterium]|nr:RNB domain-containing ribonuclease [Thermodesulfobacteriota bacterium]
MVTRNGRQKGILERIAYRAMKERGFLPDFSGAILNELEKIQQVEGAEESPGKDLRHLLWASIDNDDSLDLDQLTVAEILPDKTVKILVAVADVDSIVKRNSAIDEHARQNTTSVYTAGKTFPMLPEKLSTGLTSLNYQEDRPAMVIEMAVNEMGEIQSSDIYRAWVRNQAKLAYNSVAAWLEGKGSMPEAVAVVPGLAENLRIQDRVAHKLRSLRQEHGALDLQTLEARPIFAGDDIQDLRAEERNRAKEIIEDFMIAANGVTARFLHGRKIPSLRRMVRSPKRWGRIVEIAAQHNSKLPPEPDSKALAAFLAEEKAADPLRFPDLSLSIIKLLGPGEYVVELPEEATPGHFGLAVKDYTHSTAPNRRFPDLITQRILKTALGGSPPSYSREELADLARHCTEKEDDANKVERLVAKSAAAMLLASRIGEQFDAVCTGAADKGTWVRIFQPPIEGRLLYGYEGVDVGNRLKVQLLHTDVEKGYIDFKKIRQVPESQL